MEIRPPTPGFAIPGASVTSGFTPQVSTQTATQASATPSVLTPEKDAKLHKAATQMEGSFVQQMYKAMRTTVPQDGMFDGGSGEEMFTGLLDEHVAADTPNQWHHGLSEAIYRQMRNAVLTQAHETPSPAVDAQQPVQPLQASQPLQPLQPEVPPVIAPQR